jgi:hypothetical protein
MSPITSIYLPKIQKDVNAEFIAHIFEKNDIAKVSRISIEFNKKNKRCAYVAIGFWHDTETAYNFINRLNNPNKEARIVYHEDDWWVAEINKFPHKLIGGSSNKKTVITVFHDVFINYKKTNALKALLFGEPIQPDFIPFEEDTEDKIADIEDFNSYCREIDAERERWFSEQYIWDELSN